MADGTDITYVAFDTPMRGVCVICSQVKCGAQGGVKALYKNHATLEQVGRRCADKARAAMDALWPAQAPTAATSIPEPEPISEPAPPAAEPEAESEAPSDAPIEESASDSPDGEGATPPAPENPEAEPVMPSAKRTQRARQRPRR